MFKNPFKRSKDIGLDPTIEVEELDYVPADSTWETIGNVARTLFEKSDNKDFLIIPFEDSETGSYLSTGVWEHDERTGDMRRVNEMTAEVISGAIGQEVSVNGFGMKRNDSGKLVTSMFVKILPVDQV